MSKSGSEFKRAQARGSALRWAHQQLTLMVADGKLQVMMPPLAGVSRRVDAPSQANSC